MYIAARRHGAFSPVGSRRPRVASLSHAVPRVLVRGVHVTLLPSLTAVLLAWTATFHGDHSERRGLARSMGSR